MRIGPRSTRWLPRGNHRSDVKPGGIARVEVSERWRSTLSSATYRLFRTAILARKQIVCDYDGYRREVCPHVLGHKAGAEMALTFQFGGESKSGLPSDGEWRCFALADVRNASLREGEWRTGKQHGQPQSCVDVVDLDVNR